MSTQACQVSLLHPLCDTAEFGELVRLVPAIVRKKIRAKKIKATGRPSLINISEAAKFGMSIDDCRALLPIIRQRALYVLPNAENTDLKPAQRNLASTPAA